MSYSGAWIYSPQVKTRKRSSSPSDVFTDSPPRTTTFQSMLPLLHRNSIVKFPFISIDIHTTKFSSDSESEDIESVPVQNNRTNQKSSKPKSKDSSTKMIVPASADERKLNFVKDRMNNRPLSVSFNQPIPRRTRQALLFAHAKPHSSDETNPFITRINEGRDSIGNKKNLSKSGHVNSLNASEKNVVSRTKTPSPTVDSDKSPKNTLKVKQRSQPSPRKFQFAFAN